MVRGQDRAQGALHLDVLEFDVDRHLFRLEAHLLHGETIEDEVEFGLFVQLLERQVERLFGDLNVDDLIEIDARLFSGADRFRADRRRRRGRQESGCQRQHDTGRE